MLYSTHHLKSYPIDPTYIIYFILFYLYDFYRG